MSNLKEPYILYQYKTAEKFVALLTGIFNLKKQVSIENLENFLNLDDAVGLWLDQIGKYLNYDRPLISYGDVFGYNIGAKYNGGYIYNGNNFPAGDEFYRTVLKAIIKQRNSNFTLEEVKENIKFVLGIDKVYIYEMNKTIDIILVSYTKDINTLIKILNSLNSKWVGLPTVCNIRKMQFIKFDDIEKDIFIYNHSKYNNKQCYI